MNICIIDDDKIYQFLLKKTIHIIRESISVHSYYNGEEALRDFQKIDSICDIIFLDLNMPKMDGLEFMEAYQQLSKSITVTPKIYVATSSISEKDRLEVASYEMVKGYLVKPITLEMVQEILK